MKSKHLVVKTKEMKMSDPVILGIIAAIAMFIVLNCDEASAENRRGDAVEGTIACKAKEDLRDLYDFYGTIDNERFKAALQAEVIFGLCKIYTGEERLILLDTGGGSYWGYYKVRDINGPMQDYWIKSNGIEF